MEFADSKRSRKVRFGNVIKNEQRIGYSGRLTFKSKMKRKDQLAAESLKNFRTSKIYSNLIPLCIDQFKIKYNVKNKRKNNTHAVKKM